MEGDAFATSSEEVDLSAEDEAVVKKTLRTGSLLGSAEPLRRAISEKRPLRIAFDVAPRGRFHLGFVAGLFALKRILDVLGSRPVEAFVLIGDIEAFLDEEKCPWNAVAGRVNYLVKVGYNR